ncbi:MAG: hypothetical protein WBL20_17540 [Sphingobium sp.]|uniref:hypothetical protein n=1 Tax=Sphingobium sp. TaxID=1912891 RepID=UPI003BAF591B
MAQDGLLHQLLAGVQDLASALAPAAIGAAVGQAWEKGLSFSQRLVQWAVGICVSYYVGGGLEAWLRLDPFVSDAISFVLAMIAFKATPRFVAGAVELAGSLPADMRARWFGASKKEDADV